LSLISGTGFISNLCTTGSNILIMLVYPKGFFDINLAIVGSWGNITACISVTSFDYDIYIIQYYYY